VTLALAATVAFVMSASMATAQPRHYRHHHHMMRHHHQMMHHHHHMH
jgi:hypothetical protein